jgi:hypothetical protein
MKIPGTVPFNTHAHKDNEEVGKNKGNEKM